MNLLYVALGGATGSALRYAVGQWVTRADGAPSVATFMVNVVGSFAVGLYLGVSAERGWYNGLGLFVAVGFLGGFTTFSAFTWQTYRLAESGDVARAALNVSASLIVGLLAVWAGATLAKAA